MLYWYRLKDTLEMEPSAGPLSVETSLKTKTMQLRYAFSLEFVMSIKVIRAVKRYNESAKIEADILLGI